MLGDNPHMRMRGVTAAVTRTAAASAAGAAVPLVSPVDGDQITIGPFWDLRAATIALARA